MKKVIVITGIGGMGLAIARRIGTGYKLVLADFAQDKLEAAAKELTIAGYDIEPVGLDVVDKESVENLAQTAAGFGEIHAIIHTAGLSPTMSNAERIIAVNLIGTARIIEAFAHHLSAGTVGVMVASMAGYNDTGLDKAALHNLKTLKADELGAFVATLNIQEPDQAYTVSKLGNHLQVQAAAVTWGQQGARILSVSPGIVSTPMGQQEQKAQPGMSMMLQMSPARRIGTPEDIAAVVDFLQSPSASFMTGTDVLVDGGVTAFLKTMQSA